MELILELGGNFHFWLGKNRGDFPWTCEAAAFINFVARLHIPYCFFSARTTIYKVLTFSFSEAGCCLIREIHDPPTFSHIKFFFSVVLNQWVRIFVCPLCSHSTDVSTILYVPIFPCISSETPARPLHSYLSRSVQLCFERVVIFTVIVWFHRNSPPSLWRAGKSWPKLSDPCCKPQSGQDLSQSHHQDSSLSYTHPHSSCSFMQLKQFYVSSTDFQGTFEVHTRPLACSCWPGSICPGWGLWK